MCPGGAEPERMQHDRHLSNGCAAAARVDSHRACATCGLSLLSSHQLEMGDSGVFVLTGSFSRKAAMMGPQM